MYNKREKLKILHITPDLLTGGAEMMLLKLLDQMDRRTFEPAVVSLRKARTVGAKIRELEVPVYDIGMPRAFPGPQSMKRFLKVVKDFDPDLIQGWMYHGNIAATFIKRSLNLNVPVLWNVRKSIDGVKRERILTRLIIRLGSHWSQHPDIILYNSTTAMQQHAEMGFFAKKAHLIPNGFDLEKFKSDPAARNFFRRKLNIPSNAVLIGHLGRDHPMKSHDNFLKAFKVLLSRGRDVIAVMAGRGITDKNSKLWKIIKVSGMENVVHLLGEIDDVTNMLAALDIFVSSSSWGEGFPNVVGEAMACHIPCVVTEVGDSPQLVGDTGIIILPDNVDDLASGILRLVDLDGEERQLIGKNANDRIRTYYDIQHIARQYEILYQDLLSEREV